MSPGTSFQGLETLEFIPHRGYLLVQGPMVPGPRLRISSSQESSLNTSLFRLFLTSLCLEYFDFL